MSKANTLKEQTLKELCQLAQSALQTNTSIEESILNFENYCQAFELWHNKQAEDQDLETSADAEQFSILLSELSQLHLQVLKRAGELFNVTATQLQNFQLRAKGIMSYVDTLPKKISVTKARKG